MGQLTVEPAGAYQLFRACCRSQKTGILRLVVRSGGKQIPIGVLTPADGEYTLLRRISAAERRRLGLVRAESCCIVSEGGGLWEAADRGWELFSERELRDCCSRVTGLKWWRDGGDTLLAVPLITPFPLMPVFCLAAYQEIEGESYLVFCFRNGALVPCELEKASGVREPEDGT